MDNFLLEDLINIHNGRKYNHLSIGEIPLFGSGGIMSYVDDYLYDGKAILLPRKGTLDNIMFSDGKLWTVDTMYFSTIKNTEVVDPFYLYNYLKLLDLRHLDSGSTLPSMTKTAYSKIPVKLPNIKKQKQIAKVLSDLDAKIEVNNQINAKLEAMAKTLYDYWFVQFDFPSPPTQEGGEKVGKPYKSSGGKMVYNEELKREIPEGWEVKSLVDIANFKNGIACQKYRPIEADKYLKVIKIREMRDGFTSNTERVRDDLSNDIIINDGDILFSWSASLIVQIWAGGKGALNQHIFKVTSDSYPRSLVYFETLEYLKYFQRVAELRKTTMGHITKEHLVASRICVPPKNKLNDCLNQIDKILDKIVINKKQNQKLAELRDWLLPMLMNGQVTVNEAKEYVNGESELGMVAEDKLEI